MVSAGATAAAVRRMDSTIAFDPPFASLVVTLARIAQRPGWGEVKRSYDEAELAFGHVQRGLKTGSRDLRYRVRCARLAALAFSYALGLFTSPDEVLQASRARMLTMVRGMLDTLKQLDQLLTDTGLDAWPGAHAST